MEVPYPMRASANLTDGVRMRTTRMRDEALKA